MQSIISINNLSKTYDSGFHALDSINLQIQKGEIFALLGPNGAGKTTLISIICGIVNPGSGQVLVDGNDIISDFRAARSKIGLVPQELTTEAFESVFATVTFSRGLFGKSANPAYIEKILRQLSLWDKRDSRMMDLSGGMKRRVMIAKALSHEPEILFMDEPSAGVDVELRRDMWNMIRDLRDGGTTIILTTHYIEEAEEMADRIGIISQGKIILIEEKKLLMQKLGKRQLTLVLQTPIDSIPEQLSHLALELMKDGHELLYSFDTQSEDSGIANLMQSVASPVLSTSLYFVVFSSAIGSRMGDIDGVSYGAFIIPGLVMLTLLSESISNASFGIFFPKYSGTIYEILSAPISSVEIVIGYVGAAATKSIVLGFLILITARFFVDYEIAHPFWMTAFLVLTAVTFSLFGFIIGIWSDNWQKLQVIPLMVVTPLAFLGGSFYSISMLPPIWQTITLFNPVVYLISGFRWSFYGTADVDIGMSVGMTLLFMSLCLVIIWWIFKTGYRLRQ
ncbi:MAG: hypothetical protein COA74_13530 [Gammaproteobacteria bacterium]|nr:MAG: hypothetical protein COA74_13530 [Gammaproteobacteria bacterium]